MRGLRGIFRFGLVAISAATIMLVAALGVSASNGSLGSKSAASSVVKLVLPNVISLAANAAKADADNHKGGGDVSDSNNGRHTGECHPPKKGHKHGTPGHKHHPCGDDGDDSD